LCQTRKVKKLEIFQTLADFSLHVEQPKFNLEKKDKGFLCLRFCAVKTLIEAVGETLFEEAGYSSFDKVIFKSG
jgi:hypothetical protein